MTQPPSPRVQAMLALRLVQGVGPRTLSALLDHFPDPQVVFDPRTSLEGVPGVSPAILDRIRLAARSTALGQELEALARGNATLLARGEAGYPEQLVSLLGMPPLLYLVGDYLPADRRAVGLVGSRDATPYGRRMAQRLATGLARAGYTVISGLARGIDGVAHEAALEAGGRTLAVLANGLSGIYPPEHADLAVRVQRAGGLFSEHPMAQKPQAGLFPSRNRLISALSLAVVVVEAQAKSGALHTATHAAEQGRPLLAVPGPVDSPLSEGCNNLLREGAILCRGLDDILEAIGAQPLPDPVAIPQMVPAASPPLPRVVDIPQPSRPTAPPPGLAGQALEVWLMLGDGPLHLEVIASRLNLLPSQMMQVLFPMELSRQVRRIPGSKLERGDPRP